MANEIITMSPTKMADNLYFVGVKGGPCYLLVTDNGLVLIDTALPNCAQIIADNIGRFGFDVSNIKHIIHTHGHYDHIGSTKDLLRCCNATTYIGFGDQDAVMGKNDLLCATEANVDFGGCFVPDVIVNDGDVLDFGNVKLRFLSTPGHTQGTMSLFFDVFVDGTKYQAGMFGGSGLNTLTLDYLQKHNFPISLRKEFLASINKLRQQKVDFHIGNHMSEFNYYEKVAKLGNKSNPFLTENTYYAFLDKKENEAKELFITERYQNE